MQGLAPSDIFLFEDFRLDRHGVFTSHCGDSIKESGGAARRALGVVFVGARVAEIDRSAVANPFRDMPTEARDCGCDRILRGTDQVGQILGVELGRQCAQPDEIVEHDRQVPTLGAIL